MAKRLNPKHDEATRLKIKTSQLINRLNSFVLGEVDGKTKKPVEMSSGQVTAALGLLKKALPDLQAMEMVIEDRSRMSDEERTARIDEIRAELARGGVPGASGIGAGGPGQTKPH